MSNEFSATAPTALYVSGTTKSVADDFVPLALISEDVEVSAKGFRPYLIAQMRNVNESTRGIR